MKKMLENQRNFQDTKQNGGKFYLLKIKYNVYNAYNVYNVYKII